MSHIFESVRIFVNFYILLYVCISFYIVHKTPYQSVLPKVKQVGLFTFFCLYTCYWISECFRVWPNVNFRKEPHCCIFCSIAQIESMTIFMDNLYQRHPNVVLCGIDFPKGIVFVGH